MAVSGQSVTKMLRASLVTQGVLAIVFGIAAVFWPGLTAVTLVYLFSAFLVVDGLVVLILGLLHLKNFNKAWLLLLLGMLELGVGLYLISNPLMSFATLILLLGFSLLIRGVFSLFSSFIHKEDSNTARALGATMGALGVLIGMLIMTQPMASGLGFVWILGLYALVSGPILIALSFDVAKTSKK